MSTSLIISRFDEDLNWIKRFKNFEITIYNKGQDIQNISFGKVILLFLSLNLVFIGIILIITKFITSSI